DASARVLKRPSGLGSRTGGHDLSGRKDYAVLALGLHETALELLLVEARVQPTLLEELAMGSLLDEPAPVHHEDDVGREDGGEAVGDGDRGPSRHQGAEGFLDQPLRGRVERG